MVDEYLTSNHSFVYHGQSSDSSMVDEYGFRFLEWAKLAEVQIPLWSMNTRGAPDASQQVNLVQIPLWSMNTSHAGIYKHDVCSSDSSMVDEYHYWHDYFNVVYLVQIPLWSMNTRK